MIKRCSYEEIEIFFNNTIERIQASDGELNITKDLYFLLGEFINDYRILQEEVCEFLKKYKFEYLNHIRKYNDKITLNMSFTYDQSMFLAMPDFATIRKYSDFEALLGSMYSQDPSENFVKFLAYYRDQLKSVYHFFYQKTDTPDFITKIHKLISNTVNVDSMMQKSIIPYSSENEEIIPDTSGTDIPIEEVKDDKQKRVSMLENELELKRYYLYLLESFNPNSEDSVEKIYESLKSYRKNQTGEIQNILQVEIKFLVKLFVTMITGIQIYTFFKSMIDCNSIYNKPESHKYDNQITEDDLIGDSKNIDSESIEDVVMNYFNLNSYENIDNILSSEDKHIEKLVDKAAEVRQTTDKLKEEASDNADEGDGEKKTNVFKKVANKVKQVPVMVKTFSNKVRMYLNSRKTKWIYSRTLGKLDGLFEQYGGDAQVKENNFKDDPVLILKDQLCPDIIRIGKEVALLCDEVENLMKKASGLSNPEGVIQLANEWIKGSKLPDLSLTGEKMENITFKRKIVLGTRSRLVNIICKKNNKIYGFSFQSMVVKKLPPPNIFVISYFLLNFQEMPSAQRITDIFKSPDSFRIMASAEKKDVFQISELMNAVLKNKLTAETFDRIEARRKETKLHMRDSFKKTGKEELDKQKEKDFRDSLAGFEESLKIMFKQKLYVAEIINVFANMIMRIDKLCVHSLRAMLAVEASKVDPKFRKQMGSNVLYKTKQTEAVANGDKFQNETVR